MNDIADAIARAHDTWRECRPHQCVKGCPHLAPKERPAQGMCRRYAEHLAEAAAEAANPDVSRTWVETFVEPMGERRDADANG